MLVGGEGGFLFLQYRLWGELMIYKTLGNVILCVGLAREKSGGGAKVIGAGVQRLSGRGVQR